MTMHTTLRADLNSDRRPLRDKAKGLGRLRRLSSMVRSNGDVQRNQIFLSDPVSLLLHSLAVLSFIESLDEIEHTSKVKWQLLSTLPSAQAAQGLCHPVQGTL